MSTSSAAIQQEFDFSDASINRKSSKISKVGTASADILQLPQFPTFNYSTSVESAASRRASRLNAAAINPIELNALLDERKKLVDKELSGKLSQREFNRLKYVRWTLDRVDDARYGQDLDRLESIVSQYERFQLDIQQFQAELNRLRSSKRR